MKKYLIPLLLLPFYIHAQSYSLLSPSGKLEIRISAGKQLEFSVLKEKKTVLQNSEIGLVVDKSVLPGENQTVKKASREKILNTIIPPVKIRQASIIDQCNQLRLDFKGNCSVIFRAYDNGAAYRFVTSLSPNSIITDEIANYQFSREDSVYFPEEDSFYSHNERYYLKEKISDIAEKRFCSLPLLVFRNDGIKIALTETALEDYPGMWIKGTSGTALKAVFPKYPREVAQKSDRDVVVAKAEDFIAKTQGNREFPWRILAVSEQDKEILTNQLPYILADPCRLESTDWIKPGKVAWDWYNANNIFGVDFKSGINTETYKYYIDFASKYGIEYIILDEGWYKLGDLTSINPDINMNELIKYAEEKKVGIILWVTWKTLDDQLETALNQFQKWNIKGIKVDFMQRDDQLMVNYYYKIAREAANRHLLVDFHGAHKPAGLHRAFPNVLSFEGVKGAENNKWTDKQTPEHNTTLPFIRMFAGPMDYTPGGMLNAHAEDYKISWERPMAPGTRCHQLGMYVVYESPLQMLADSPTNYLHESECMQFLSKVPSTWDKTVPLEAKVGDYVIIARQKEGQWYLGGMNDSQARTLEVSLDFLDQGEYTAEIYQDGINADRVALDFKSLQKKVSRNDKLRIDMARDGGYAARIFKTTK